MTKGKDYIEGRWGDHINYECTRCQFSTLWIAKMDKHIEAKVHVWAFPGGGAKKRRRKKVMSEPTY